MSKKHRNYIILISIFFLILFTLAIYIFVINVNGGILLFTLILIFLFRILNTIYSLELIVIIPIIDDLFIIIVFGADDFLDGLRFINSKRGILSNGTSLSFHLTILYGFTIISHLFLIFSNYCFFLYYIKTMIKINKK